MKNEEKRLVSTLNLGLNSIKKGIHDNMDTFYVLPMNLGDLEALFSFLNTI